MKYQLTNDELASAELLISEYASWIVSHDWTDCSYEAIADAVLELAQEQKAPCADVDLEDVNCGCDRYDAFLGAAGNYIEQLFDAYAEQAFANQYEEHYN